MNYRQILVTSIAKAAVFDLLAIYPISYAFNSPFPTYAKLEWIAVVAVASYTIRSYVREYNEEINSPYIASSVVAEYKNIAGGCLGNSFKYVVRSLPEKATPIGMMKNAFLGCINGALYEADNDKKLNIHEGTAPIYIEAAEELIKAGIAGEEDIVKGFVTGLAVGVMLYAMGEFIYSPIDNYVQHIISTDTQAE